MLLKNKVAVITGAASVRGLGFATAKLYAEQGAKVVIIDLNAEASRCRREPWRRTSGPCGERQQ